MVKQITGIVLLLASLVAEAADRKNHGSIVVNKVTSIYDADTFRVTINGWPPLIGEHIPIRADGFDAPEIRGKCQKEKEGAQVSKQLTVSVLRNADIIELRNMRRGKYFRIIADVYVDGAALKELHLNAGTARPYSGGKRAGWCD